jgi:outer membrane protein assembly factor BamB
LKRFSQIGPSVSRLRAAAWMVVVLSACGLATSATCLGGDWPQWRYDASCGAASPEELPGQLHLQWMRQLPEPRPAWPPSQPSLRFDVSYSPVAAGGMLFVPSMVTDSVTAYDAATGQEKWRFYTDAPVRFAPIADGGKVYFVSDDGFLYCLDAARGALVWRFRGGPYDRKVLGNERLISTWPARGGPVLRNGTIYFTAGIWPFMGIFVHAVDAATGRAVWTNSGDGSRWTVQPHASPAFSGFVPHGYLAATERDLIVPGGRTIPACYDPKTGQLRHFDFGDGKEGTVGSYQVVAHDPWFLQNGKLFATADGGQLMATSGTVQDERALYGVDGKEIFAQTIQRSQAAAQLLPGEHWAAAKKGKQGAKGGGAAKPGAKGAGKGRAGEYVAKDLWRAALAADLPKHLFIKAGSRLILGGAGVVAAVAIPPAGGPVQASWKGTFEGDPWTMLAADGRLFVVTTAGRIYCFGPDQGEAKTHSLAKPQTVQTANSPAREALAAMGVKDGYGLILGMATPGLAEVVLGATNLRLIAIAPEADKVEAARRRMDEMGLYGTRLTAHVGQVQDFALPPYLASLIVVDSTPPADPAGGAGLVRAVFAALRPYGGVALFRGLDVDTLQQWTKQADLAGARVEAGKAGSCLARPGALPGAGQWTHQYADAANSVVSQDRLVKAPLGLLWFGGPSNDEVLPRHGHGPAPQVAGGRLVIEGANMLRAVDVYTGRLLWQKSLPGLGKFYDSTNHQPGAGEIGSNYVTLPDAVYVIRGPAIIELDAATGEKKKEFRLAAAAGSPDFGFLAVSENLLVATAAPVTMSKTGEQPFAAAPYAVISRKLVAFDRQSGKLLWQTDAKYAFRHNAVAVGGGRVYAIDGLSAPQTSLWKGRAKQPAGYQPQLLALDAKTGGEVWSTRENVFGTFLNYSVEHDALLQSGSSARDRAKDEADTGMVVYHGSDGKVLWKDLKRAVEGPCLLHHDTIITQSSAYGLLTGKTTLRKDPLTGEETPWQFKRNYGCNTIIGCENLLTFRSATAGYFDLARDGGTGNLGGFKTGCTSNLVVADGVFNAPEYTRTCVCCYSNQTSLALVHDPQAESWTFNSLKWKGDAVRQVGINFGAPGDRRADNGTLWLDFPSQGGPSPDVPVEIKSEKPEYFCHHSGLIKVLPGSQGLNWVAASGVRNIGGVTVTLSQSPSPQPRKYTVRLHFAEVEPVAPGQRVFQVRLQGADAGPEIDVVKEAGPMTALVKEFQGVAVTDKLALSFEPRSGSLPAVLCGIEVVAEGW